VGLVAPRIFDDYHELNLGLALGCLLLLGARWQDSRGWLHRTAPRWRWAVAVAVTAILMDQWGSGIFARHDELLLLERTFFGVLRIQQFGDGDSVQRQLFNGTTMHGVQFPGSERRPTSYYGELTGIGLALVQRESNDPSEIGVVGLGIGTLAAYGRPGDHFRFYEIDPAVIRIARNPEYFTYLAHSRAKVEVVEGDARVSLASELKRDGSPRFDFLIIDAFNSDAIPVHLLTREAFELYGKLLKPKGLLAVHVSNRRLDLTPLVARLGSDAGFAVAAIATNALGQFLSGQSLWAFLSRDPRRLSSLLEFATMRHRQLGLPEGAIRFRGFSAAEIAEIPLWTDDYSDLFGVMLPVSIVFDPEPEPR
jgi:spermidine synthase